MTPTDGTNECESYCQQKSALISMPLAGYSISRLPRINSGPAGLTVHKRQDLRRRILIAPGNLRSGSPDANMSLDPAGFSEARPTILMMCRLEPLGGFHVRIRISIIRQIWHSCRTAPKTPPATLDVCAPVTLLMRIARTKAAGCHVFFSGFSVSCHGARRTRGKPAYGCSAV